MDIQTLGAVQAVSAAASLETVQHSSAAATAPAVDNEPAAVFSKSEKIDTGAYTKNGTRAQAVAEALKAAEQQRIATLTSTISTLFQKQSVFGAKATSSKVEFSYEFLSSLNVNAMTAQDATAAIADDGEWGVNAVATRIMDMAVALSGGDTQKASTLKAAMLKGFDEAGVAWGRELPDISQRTKAELLTRFDYWQENGTMDGYEMAAAAIQNQ